MQAVHHGRLSAVGVALLLRQDKVTSPGLTRIEQKHASLAILESICWDLEGRHCDITVAAHLVTVEAAPYRNVLVLLAHRVAGEVDLDVAGPLRKLPLRYVVPFKRWGGQQQS